MEDESNDLHPAPTPTPTPISAEEENELVEADETPAPDSGDGEGEGDAAVEGVEGGEIGGGGKAEIAGVRRKRDKPRKYQAYENAIAGGGGSAPPTTRLGEKRGRGRPRGSGKLQMLTTIGELVVDLTAANLTPFALTVQRGENMVEKVVWFAQRGEAICVLTAIGAVSLVDICSSGSFAAGGIIRHEGYFELLKLSGTYNVMDVGGVQKTNMLSVLLANPDGSILGGAVGGCLIAARPVQIMNKLQGTIAAIVELENLVELILASFKQSRKKLHRRRHSVGHSIPIHPPGNINTPVVPILKGKAPNLGEENSAGPNGMENITGNQNVNHASPQSSDQIASQPSDHLSGEGLSDDMDGGAHDTQS